MRAGDGRLSAGAVAGLPCRGAGFVCFHSELGVYGTAGKGGVSVNTFNKEFSTWEATRWHVRCSRKEEQKQEAEQAPQRSGTGPVRPRGAGAACATVL